MVMSIQLTRGRLMLHIMRNDPTTVTMLVIICTMSVPRLVEITSMS